MEKIHTDMESAHPAGHFDTKNYVKIKKKCEKSPPFSFLAKIFQCYVQWGTSNIHIHRKWFDRGHQLIAGFGFQEGTPLISKLLGHQSELSSTYFGMFLLIQGVNASMW